VFPRFAIGLGFLILLLAVGLVALGVHWMGRTVPSYTGTVAVHGISSNVTIDRDGYAIPHIHAATERDAWFGLGYAEAQDRMFQMELTRRIGQGRLCEIFGKRSRMLDEWAHTIGFARIADRMWSKAGSHTRDVVTAFTAGINEYLHERRTKLGFEFDALALAPEDWRPQDCYIIARLMSWEMNFSYLSDAAFSDLSVSLDSAHMKSLFPDYPEDGATVLEGADPRNFVSNYLKVAPIPAVMIGPRAEDVHPALRPNVQVDTAVVRMPIDTNATTVEPTASTPKPAATLAAPASKPKTGVTVPGAKPKPAVKPAPRKQPPPFKTEPGQTPPPPPSRPPVKPPKPRTPGALQPVGSVEASIFHELAEIEKVIDSVAGLHVGGGSNAFVIAPQRSLTGGALIENDPHLSLKSPSRWYLAHMTSDDGVNVIGHVVPGMPAFITGRTPELSWGITNAMADESDFFIEKYDSSRTKYVMPNGSVQKFTIIHDTIRIRDSVRTNPMQVIPFDVMMTVRGPIVTGQHPDRVARTFEGTPRAGGVPDTGIFGRGTMPVSLQWNGQYALSDELASFLNLLHAKNVSDARNGMSSFATPCLNICFADARGNIGYQYIGRMPRRSGSEERLMLARDATNTADQWIGFVQMSQLPTVQNPQRGYIVSANNPPTRNRTFAYSNNWEPDSRADRITERIETKRHLGVEDLASIQTDVISPYDLRRVLQFLLALYPDPHPPRTTPDSPSPSTPSGT